MAKPHTNFQGAFAKARRKRGLPAPAAPPEGTYDPQFDAQGRNLQRSYDDLLQNFGIGKQRSQDDLNLALGNLDTSKTNALTDLNVNRERQLQDLGQQSQYATEDHAAALDALGRKYTVLGHQQEQAARHAGVESQGILAQSLAKRAANRGIEQQPIDTNFTRSQMGIATGEQRLGEDYSTNTARTTQDASQRSDALKLAFDRAFGPSGDNVLNLSRAGRDLNAGLLDINSSKWYGATANGYAPPPTRRRRKAAIY